MPTVAGARFCRAGSAKRPRRRAPIQWTTRITAIADFAGEYTNIVSAAMTSEYVEQTRVLAAAERDRGAELLGALLAGYDESDGRIARLLKSSGYLEQRQSYCVVAARSANAGEMEQPARVQRIIASLSDLIAATNIRALAGARGAAVIAVMSTSRRQSGWTAPQTNLAERLQSLLLQWGPAVLVGVSADQPSTSAIPKALREATVALEFASVARRVVQFSALPARSLLVHAGGEFLRATQPAWAAAFACRQRSRPRRLAENVGGFGGRRPQRAKGGARPRRPRQYDLCPPRAHPRAHRPRRPAPSPPGRVAAGRGVRAGLRRPLASPFVLLRGRTRDGPARKRGRRD